MADTASPVLPPKKRRTGIIIGAVIAAIAIVVIVIVVVTAGRGGGDALGSPNDPVRIGVVGASDPYWETFREAALDEDISIELVDFAEYPQPNPALTEGEIDLNQFQHIIYLAQYNEASGEDLAPIGSTAIYPLALYSTQYGSVEEIPDGSTVAVPSDPSNLARGLLVLQSAGLIELSDGGSIFSTLDDVDTEASRVQVTALEAALTATSLPDVAAAIINNDFVEDAGLSFEDAIAQDDPEDPNAAPYINIFAARAQDRDSELFARIVEIFQNTQEVQDGLIEVSGGTAVQVKTPVVELQDALETVQQDIETQG